MPHLGACDYSLQNLAFIFLAERKEDSLSGIGLGVNVGDVVYLGFDEKERGGQLSTKSINELIRGLVDNRKSIRWGEEIEERSERVIGAWCAAGTTFE